eukprot:Plantae.Rhodophyta-Palmaria_palmata.ctg11329.p1 GENE.Plantae.Rhodophyta-Palmaria_palmata.ctg11329~~Plantae.Rhodophyta-Palmaria_palmata.ctg11329.p1  ORF type:complete len:181 (+),score=19.58 Plantae.Rhodophyta-Palmaria_palmata.ctg11329:445-987(+)
MCHWANNFKESIAVIVIGDILLFDDFMDTIAKVVSKFDHFLIAGARYDIESFPHDTDENDPSYAGVVRGTLTSAGTLHIYGGIDFWAWNTNGPRLFDPVMPHFILGRGKYDHWFTHETVAAGRRDVIDVSETCLAVHVRHVYPLVKSESPTRNRSLSWDASSVLSLYSGSLVGEFLSEGK